MFKFEQDLTARFHKFGTGLNICLSFVSPSETLGLLKSPKSHLEGMIIFHLIVNVHNVFNNDVFLFWKFNCASIM